MRDTNLVNALREHADWWENGDMMDPLGGLEKDLLAAADRLENQNAHIAALQQEIEKLRGQLKAYEDTELTPEEINDLASVREISPEAEYAINKHADNIIERLDKLLHQTDDDARLRELAEADRAGRLVVLPCKVGETLWVTGRDNVPREMELEAPDIRAVCTDEDNLCMSTCNRKPDGFCAYRLRNDGADIGKTVFLTREEAEKALEAKKDE